jgi:ribosomal protein S27E
MALMGGFCRGESLPTPRTDAEPTLETDRHPPADSGTRSKPLVYVRCPRCGGPALVDQAEDDLTVACAHCGTVETVTRGKTTDA